MTESPSQSELRWKVTKVRDIKSMRKELKGRGQNLERRNVERPIFRNFQIANIKITKDESFENFIFQII